MKVKKLMTRDLTSVTEETSLKDAARILANHTLSGLPVVDNQYKLVGFISERDIIKSAFPGMFGSRDEFIVHNFAQLYNQLSSIGEKLVRDFMTRDVQSVTEEMTAEEVAELMLNQNYKIIPVVRDNRLVGVINRAQLCRFLMEKPEEED